MHIGDWFWFWSLLSAHSHQVPSLVHVWLCLFVCLSACAPLHLLWVARVNLTGVWFTSVRATTLPRNRSPSSSSQQPIVVQGDVGLHPLPYDTLLVAQNQGQITTPAVQWTLLQILIRHLLFFSCELSTEVTGLFTVQKFGVCRSSCDLDTNPLSEDS